MITASIPVVIQISKAVMFMARTCAIVHALQE